ncbi:MAG: D-alanine--D-alanine ligase [Oscillospiraceae bacterium]|nr:D-alanine--D-alanine ligase [Oscillospiraceae bacterium]
MNILVLAGGHSPERDVSLASGANVVQALRSRGHQVLLLDPYKSIDLHGSFAALYAAYAQENYAHSIPSQAPDLAAFKAEFGNGDDMLGRNVLVACKLADVVFLALHGSLGENGQLQATLDLHAVRYTGSGHVGCALAMDKNIAKIMMQAAGVQTPLCAAASAENLPLVVKPANGGSSIGCSIARTADELAQALADAREQEDNIVIERFIEGREFSVGVLDGQVLPVIEIIPNTGWFDYANKYQGTTDEICPADIPDDLAQTMQAAALNAHNALRLGSYSRVDFMTDAQGEIYCLEANTLPGLAPASLLPQEAAAAGISYEDLCEKIVSLAM